MPIGILSLLAALTGAASQAAVLPASAEQIVARHTVPIALENGRLTGSGAERLLAAAGNAQFVIVIEPHNDQVTPIVTAALFSALHERSGFNYLAIEQDPLGMEAASSPRLRGRLPAIARHARAFPYSFTFATDEELDLIATAGRVSTGRWEPVWGVDQLFGATAALEELAALAQGGPAEREIAALLLEAREAEARRNAEGDRDQAQHHFLSRQAPRLLPRVAQARRLMTPAPGSRAAHLLDAIEHSARIYGYYRPEPPTDAAGTPLGLLNNAVREDLMKTSFLRHYRLAEAADGALPRVVVKAGYWHAVRGMGPGSVFTLGNFLHEFAIANGSSAVSVQVLALREWWPTFAAVDPPYRALLTAETFGQPLLVDLRPLRNHFHAGQRFGLAGEDLATFRALVFGVDFALFMPSRPGGRSLTRVPAAAPEGGQSGSPRPRAATR